MHSVFNNNIKWVNITKEAIQSEPFCWGSEWFTPGRTLKQLGNKGRTSFNLTDASLKYVGRINNDLYFAVINDSNQSSESDGWFVELSYVNHSTLLAQTSKNGFYDIKF